MLRHAWAMASDPDAQAEIKVDAIQITEHRVTSALTSGQNPGPLSSMLKTQGTEMLQRIEELGLDIAAHYAPAGGRAASGENQRVGTPQSRDAAARYFNSRAASSSTRTPLFGLRFPK